MREIAYRDALNEALREEMRRDKNVFIIGEEVGLVGGTYKITKGLIDKYGPERVRDTPISEAGFVGIGIGAALVGMRPIVDLMFADFMSKEMMMGPPDKKMDRRYDDQMDRRYDDRYDKRMDRRRR